MKQKLSVGCVGQGFVGSAVTTGMSHAFDVLVFDKDETKQPASGGRKMLIGGRYVKSIGEFVEVCENDFDLDRRRREFTQVYFVCVPTPMRENGECDTSIVESVLIELSKEPRERIAVVKSTVTPGSTERWNRMVKDTGLTVVFNPEFLTERNAIEDFKNQSRIILGGPKKAVNRVRDLYREAYPNVPVVKTSSVNAEMNKYVINTFLATKVSFANEIYQLCEALKARGDDVDYDRIVEIVTMDERVGKSHWQVPGPMPDDKSGQLVRGWGGSCFVKDLNALKTLMIKLGVDPKVLQGVWYKNLEVRPQKDWLELKGRAVVK